MSDDVESSDSKERFKNPTGTRIKIATYEELCAFLLDKEMGGFNAEEHNLTDEVNAAATSGDQTKEQREKEAQTLRIAAEQKAQKDAERFRLSDEDAIALKQLYVGFTQADLIGDSKPYKIKITCGPTTNYPLSVIQQSPEGPTTDKPLNLFGQRDMERLKVSPTLYEVLLSEFDSIGLWDKGTQIRRSKDPLFLKTAMHAGAIIQMFGEDPFDYPVAFLQAVPINQIKQTIIGFDTFRRDIGSNQEN